MHTQKNKEPIWCHYIFLTKFCLYNFFGTTIGFLFVLFFVFFGARLFLASLLWHDSFSDLLKSTHEQFILGTTFLARNEKACQEKSCQKSRAKKSRAKKVVPKIVVPNKSFQEKPCQKKLCQEYFCPLAISISTGKENKQRLQTFSFYT